MEISYLLENILDARSDKGKYNLIEKNKAENIYLEHCDICNGKIENDEKNWQSERIILCEYCYNEYIINFYVIPMLSEQEGRVSAIPYAH